GGPVEPVHRRANIRHAAVDRRDAQDVVGDQVGIVRQHPIGRILLLDSLVEVDVVVVGDNDRVNDNGRVSDLSDLGAVVVDRLYPLLPRVAHGGHGTVDFIGIVHGGVDAGLVDEAVLMGVGVAVAPQHPRVPGGGDGGRTG